MGKFQINLNIQIGINKGRCIDLVNTVLDLRADVPMFQNPASYPDAIVPQGVKKASQKHALFLFYGCSIDAMRSADEVYRGVRSLHQEQSVVTIYKVGKRRLEKLLKKYCRNTEMGNIVKAVYDNSRKLKSEYENDPRNLFNGFSKKPNVEELKELQERIGKFYGYGPGKAALLIKNFVRFGMWEIPETFVPIKIDRHVARVCLGFEGLINFYENNRKIPHEQYKKRVGAVRVDQFNQKLQDLFLEIIDEINVSGIELDDTLWLLGSKWCYKNQYVFCKTNCPIDCYERPKSDPTTTVFFPGIDKREGIGQKVLYQLGS